MNANLSRAQQAFKELVTLRRDFHAHPELSWKERRTQQKILEYLDKWGIPAVVSTGTGVIATLEGARNKDVILGIRADIDALPLTEAAHPPYVSQNQGCMHACGHDTHIAMLLVTARLLAEKKDDLPLTVRFLFQPAEEYIADSGALHMKEDPLVKAMTRMIAIHIQGMLPYGMANLQEGPIMAASDTFDIFIKGRGGHGAHPEEAIYPIAAGVAYYNAVQTLVSRETKALDAPSLALRLSKAVRRAMSSPKRPVLWEPAVPSALRLGNVSLSSWNGSPVESGRRHVRPLKLVIIMERRSW